MRWSLFARLARNLFLEQRILELPLSHDAPYQSLERFLIAGIVGLMDATKVAPERSWSGRLSNLLKALIQLATPLLHRGPYVRRRFLPTSYLSLILLIEGGDDRRECVKLLISGAGIHPN